VIGGIVTNKEVVLKFYEEVFNGWDVSNIDQYMTDDYIQHNPNAETGKAGFLKFHLFFDLILLKIIS
jgi:predicted SnoaL-like aldol condensation-catalyzing enzyme